MEDSTRPIRIVVINGSVHPNNYTSMASAYVVDELRKEPEGLGRRSASGRAEPSVPRVLTRVHRPPRTLFMSLYFLCVTVAYYILKPVWAAQFLSPARSGEATF